MKVPKGFRFAGIHAGIKPVRRDLALVVSDQDAVLAACLTANAAAAAPVLETRPRVPCTHARAVLVNSGNANALTGDAGVEDARKLQGAVAQALGVEPAAVFSAST